ncbi:MAG: MFS transporter, partial [Dehalococcoidia bacterium]
MSSIIHRSRFITRGPHQKWWVFFAIAIGMFVVVMEQTGVNIALPKIAEHFDLDIPTVQWVTLGYVLSTSAMFMPLGRISDMIGRTRVYVFSFMIFMVAAAVGGS